MTDQTTILLLKLSDLDTITLLGLLHYFVLLKAAPLSQSYLYVAAGTEQHCHVSEHPDNGEGNRGHALCVHHVWIVPACWVTKDVASLSAVTPGRRKC